MLAHRPLTVGMLALAAVTLACATRTLPFRDAPAQPAALGEAKVRVDDNENAQVELWVEHLAKPERLTPPKTTYVLWAESTFGRTVLLGRLRVSEDLKAYWRGSVPFDRFRLVISAEDHSSPEDPSAPFIMTTDFIAVRYEWI